MIVRWRSHTLESAQRHSMILHAHEMNCLLRRNRFLSLSAASKPVRAGISDLQSPEPGTAGPSINRRRAPALADARFLIRPLKHQGAVWPCRLYSNPAAPASSAG